MKTLRIIVPVIVLALVGCGPPPGFAPSSNMNLTVHENGGPVVSMDIAPGVNARAVTTEFYVGLPRQDVFDTLEDPDHIFMGETIYTPGVDNDKDAYHMYFALGLSFQILGDFVTEITLLNDNWIASNGLIVGMSRLQMLEILGDDYGFIPSEVKDFYQYDQFDISVEVYHAFDSVGEIAIKEGNAR